MTLPPKRYEASRMQQDINDLILWAETLLITGGGVPATRNLTAGDGLTGGGDLSTDRTLALGTPGSITTTSTNGVSPDSHTHAATGFEPTISKGNLTAGSNKITIGGTGTGAVIGAGATVDVVPGNISHNDLANKQGGAAGEFNHLTNAQVSALHASVTLKAGHDEALSLSGQELDLAAVLTPTEHTAIGNGAPHHAPVTGGNGIAVTGQEVAIDPTDGNTWTGAQVFQGSNTHRTLKPETNNTYDIGLYNDIWRTAYISNIMATIFAENTIQLIGGAFIIPKEVGTLPAVASGDATINFGKTMTPDDHLLIKSQTTDGTYATEYVKVGTLVSGTTYNVTRDEAGAHATDPAWPSGTPYAVLGQTGNGFIQLDATTTPRMSINSQGANYNSQTEVVRIGDLNGLSDYTSEIYGAYFGAAEKASLTVDPTNGLRMRTPDGETTFDDDGISVLAPETVGVANAIKFYAGTDMFGQLYGWQYTADKTAEGVAYFDHVIKLEATEVAAWDSQIFLYSEAPTAYRAGVRMQTKSGTAVAYASLLCLDDVAASQFALGKYGGGLYDNAFTFDILTGDLTYDGALKSYKNSTAYTGYIYVPLAAPLTSTSWDGDNKTSANNGTVDLSAVFGVPAGVKAIKVTIQLTCNTANKYANFGPSSTYSYMFGQLIQVANQPIVIHGDITCDSNGDFYFSTNSAAGSEMGVYIRIWGYYI